MKKDVEDFLLDAENFSNLIINKYTISNETIRRVLESYDEYLKNPDIWENISREDYIDEKLNK